MVSDSVLLLFGDLYLHILKKFNYLTTWRRLSISSISCLARATVLPHVFQFFERTKDKFQYLTFRHGSGFFRSVSIKIISFEVCHFNRNLVVLQQHFLESRVRDSRRQVISTYSLSNGNSHLMRKVEGGAELHE